MNEVMESAFELLILRSAVQTAVALSPDPSALSLDTLKKAIQYEIGSSRGICRTLKGMENIIVSLEPEDLEDDTVRGELSDIVGSDMFADVSSAVGLVGRFHTESKMDEMNRSLLLMATSDVDLNGTIADALSLTPNGGISNGGPRGSVPDLVALRQKIEAEPLENLPEGEGGVFVALADGLVGKMPSFRVA